MQSPPRQATAISLIGPEWAQRTFERIQTALQARGYETCIVNSTGVNIAGRDYSDDIAWRDAEFIVALAIPIDAPRLSKALRLRAVVAPAIGVDWVDLQAATAQGVAIINCRVPEHADSMAEATIMLMLAALYGLPTSQRYMARTERPPPTARMATGKTIGVIGYGSIAKAVIARLAGWNVRILIATRTAPQPSAAYEAVHLERLLALSDVILVLAELNDETRHLLDATRLALTKRGVVIVNTARGAIIDEHALYRAIEHGQVGSVALDVFETEPLSPESPLRGLDHALLTPHCVGMTAESTDALQRQAIQNMLDLLCGELPASLCNPAVRERWLRAC